MDIRPAVEADLPAVGAIYAPFVLETHVTFDIAVPTDEERAEWFTHYGTNGRYRLLVAEAGGKVVGWASSSRLFPRGAYETSVTTSVYVERGYGGHGIGTALYRALLDVLGTEDVHRTYGGIALPNAASIALHERFGYRRVALFSEQGRKFGRYWDVAWYEKTL